MPRPFAMMTVVVAGALVVLVVGVQAWPTTDPVEEDVTPVPLVSSPLSAPISAAVSEESPSQNQTPIEPATPPVVTAQISVTIEVQAGSEAKEYQVSLEEGSTVYAALSLAGLNYSFPVLFQESEYGAFVEGINGVSSDVANSRYWIWYINDQSATVSVDNYFVQDGDRIRFVYE